MASTPIDDDGLVVEDGTQGDAVVGGLPDAAAGGGDEEGLRWAGNAGDIGDAPLEVCRSDGSPAEAGECERIERLCLSGDRDAREGDTGEEGKDSETMHTHSQGVGRNGVETILLRSVGGEC